MSDIVKVQESFLNLSEPVYIAENIKKTRWEDYYPQEVADSFNRDVSLNIIINNIDNYILLEDSCFIFDVELQNIAKTLFTSGDISISNNGIMYLFDRVSLRFDDRIIEEYTASGQTTLVQGLLKYDVGFSKSSGLQQCWSIDEYNYSASDVNLGFKGRKSMLFSTHTEKGKCRFIIPFSHIFGFKGKILSGIKLSIQFHRKNNADSIFKSATTTGDAANRVDSIGDGSVIVKGISWRVPYIDLNTSSAVKISEYLVGKPNILYKFITKQVEEFQAEQNRILDRTISTISGSQKILGIVVCFQTNRSNMQKANASVFDDVKVTDGYVSLNNVQYPGFPLNSDSKNGNYMTLYERFKSFREHFSSGIPEISPIDFALAYPIYCFDTSNQEQRIYGNSISVKLHLKFSENIPVNTNCYVIIFKETIMSVTTTGDRKMQIQDVNTF